MQIKNFPNYSCDENGNVFSKGKKLKQAKRNGYLGVTLCNSGFKKSVNVHRIIAETFIPNPENKPQVNHKNGDKADNRLSNLEWVTRSENTIHAILNNLFIPPLKNRKDLSKKVEQIKNGKVIAVFDSANEAERQTGFSTAHISRCANGGSYRISGGEKKWINCKSVGGYQWRWKEVQSEIEKL